MSTAPHRCTKYSGPLASSNDHACGRDASEPLDPWTTAKLYHTRHGAPQSACTAIGYNILPRYTTLDQLQHFYLYTQRCIPISSPTGNNVFAYPDLHNMVPDPMRSQVGSSGTVENDRPAPRNDGWELRLQQALVQGALVQSRTYPLGSPATRRREWMEL